MLRFSGPGQVLGSYVANQVLANRLVQWLGWVLENKERKKKWPARCVPRRRGFPQGPRRKNLAGWFLKKIFPGGPYQSSVTNARGGEAWRRNVWRPVYIRLSLQVSLTLACIKALSKTLPNKHGASHVPAPRLNSTSVGDWALARSPREDFFSKIIRPNSSFGAPEGSPSSGVRNALGADQGWRNRTLIGHEWVDSLLFSIAT